MPCWDIQALNHVRVTYQGLAETYNKKRVDEEVKKQGWKVVARVAIVPEKYLGWNDNSGVEQKHPTDEKNYCGQCISENI